MQGLFQAKKLIDNARDVLILTSENPEVDSLGSALSLSYILNNAGKVVNFFPKKIPKNYVPLFPEKIIPEKFVISVRGKEISELYYEKENQILNIFLSSRNDKIQEEDIGFRDLSAKKDINQESDLLITVGIERLEQLGDFYEKNFKLFYQSPILNIDNKSLNNKFGNINLISDNMPIAAASAKLISAFNIKMNQDIRTWLLAGIIEFSQTKKTNQGILEIAFNLCENNINYQKIIEFFISAGERFQTKLLETVLRKIKLDSNKYLPVVCLTKKDFKNSDSAPKNLGSILDQLTNNFFHLPSLLLLWESNSVNNVRGVFYSPNIKTVMKIAQQFKGEIKAKGTIFSMKEQDISRAKERLMEIV